MAATPYGAAASAIPWKVIFYALVIAALLHVSGVYTLADWVAAGEALFGGIADTVRGWVTDGVGDALP
jgi:hypothetical protein